MTIAVRRSRLLAIVVWGVVALDVALVLSLAIPGDFPLLTIPVILVVVTSLGGVGALTATRLPANVVGWILWATGFIVAISLAGSTYATESVLRFDGGLPLTVPIAVVSQMTIVPTLGLIGAFLPLLFPTGGLPSRRWLPVAWACAASIMLATVIEVAMPGSRMGGSGIVNPFGVAALASIAGPLMAAQTLALAIPCAIAVTSIGARFRSAAAEERAQLKWFGWAGLVLLISQLIGSSNIGPLADWGWVLDVGGLAFVPLAIGIAILRYRLYEIDRIVSRTLAWALVTLVLVGVFSGLVVGLQALLTDVTQGQTLAVAASTLVAFALAQPVRLRVQRAVDRRFNRARYDAERIALAFGATLRAETDPSGLERRLRSVATQAVQPSTAMLWLRPRTHR